MRRKKKLISVLLIFALSIGLGGCHIDKKTDNSKYKLNIVTTLFPYYDFTRAVIGDVEGINLQMTVAPGQDSHSFEPTPADVININNADIFIYNGGSLETWVGEILRSSGKGVQTRIRMMDFAHVLEEETVEGMDTRFEGHDHDGDLTEDEHEEHGEEDEHIWTSPVNAKIFVQKICDELCAAMPWQSQKFKANAGNYISELEKIDGEFREITEQANLKEIIFADRFPLLYFAKEYGLKYYAAFPGCGSDMEPSAKTIVYLINKIKQDNIKAVFYLELSSQAVADTISQDTGAKKLQFNSCHNITQRQFDDKVTYVNLMEDNVKSLREALGD